LVFSTKERRPWIDESWRGRLHAFVGGAVNALGGVPVAIGGVADHVHLLVGLKATHAVADVVKEVKVASAKWIHEELGVLDFAWQEGYGAFSVSPSSCESVAKYVRNQEEHHRVKSFQEEYREFLEKAGVKYEERFLW
jgi:putative transposase